MTLLPVGATEQHGPHLPLGTDWWLAEAVATGAARLAPGTDVAAALPYGVSPHHLGLTGTLTLRPRTFIDLLVGVCGSLADAGRIPLVVNGHGGNRGALQVAVTELGAAGRTAWALSYFELLDDVVAEEFTDGHRHVGHACALETSLVMHLWPDKVACEKIPAAGTPPTWPDPHLYGTDHVTTWRPFDEINPTGVVGTPALARPDAGRRLYETATRRVADIATRIRAGVR